MGSRATAALSRPVPAVRRTFASLHHRDFRIFYVGQAISVTGTWMQQVAMGWLALVLTGSPFLLGVVSAARSLPVLVLSFAGGAAADRFPKRRLLLVANATAMVLSVVLAVLTAIDRIDVTALALIGLGIGITNAFEMPARQSYFVELVGPRHLMNAIALNSLLFNGARIIGPALAGVVVAALGAEVAFALNAVSFVAVLISLILVKTEAPPVAAAKGRAALAEVMAFLRHEPRVALLLGLLGVNTIFASGYLVLGPVIAVDLGQGAEGLGLLLSATGLGAIAGGLALAAGQGTAGRARMLMIAGAVLAASLVGVALSRSFALTLLLLAGAGWGMVTYTALSNTLIQILVPDALRGRIMSFYTIVMLGFVPVTSLLAGTLAQLWGAPVAIASGALIWVSVMGLTFWRSRGLRAL